MISAFLLTTLTFAAPVCGGFDVGAATNRELTSVVFFADGARLGSPPARTQCGLPGERLAICSACSPITSEETMSYLRPILAAPGHSEWHSGWHKVRGELLPEAEVLQLAGSLPAGENLSDFIRLHTNQGDLAGEDFFYMHRTMIKMVQVELAAANLPCIAPWNDLPKSIHDRRWPVPKKWTDSASEKAAEETLQQLRRRLAKMRQPERLRKVSLNKFGLALEKGIHQDLHNFYRGNPVCSPEARAQGICDDLIPTNTSPANKYFWKIHGLIDEMLGDWLRANGYDEIAHECEDRAGCYEWKGSWYGQYPRQ